MIDFACKRISEEELVRCGFGINRTEFNIFYFLIKQKQRTTVEQIAKKLELKRSTVQKAIKILIQKKLIARFQQNLKKGGYKFFYEINNKPKIKKELEDILKSWCRKAIEKINEL